MIKSRFAFPRFLAAASVLLCIVSSAKAQEKVLLRMNLHQGQTFDQGFVMETETFGNILNEKTVSIVTQQIGVHDEVLHVDKNGAVKLKMTFQSLVSKDTTTNKGKVESSSSDDSTRHIPVIVGQSVIVTISSRGNLTNIEGIDTIAKKQAADIKDPSMREFKAGLLKDILGSMSEQSVGKVAFPQPAIAVGDSWTEKNSQIAFLPFQSDMRYTLMSSKNGVATIAAFSQIKTSFMGTYNGVIRVDEKTGLIISSELHRRMWVGAKPAITRSKNISYGKSKSAASPSFFMNAQVTMRRWTVKLPQ